MAFSLIGVIVGLLISTGVGAILRALTRTPQAPVGKVEVPHADEGEAIPAIFGTVKLAPNIVWWGDVRVEPIKGPRRVFGLVGPRDTVGHKYHVGMMASLCWGQVDALVEIIVDGKYKLSTFGTTTSRSYNEGTGLYDTSVNQVVSPSLPLTTMGFGGSNALTITANNLFGGKELEGGVSGTVRFHFGWFGALVNSYLQTNARNPFPSYKGLCYAAFEQTYLGTVPYLKHWHFVLRRCPTTLGTLAGDTAKSRIGDDANPAEILWEIYTDTRWGLGRSSADLDEDSFLAALTTLKTEGCGISGQITANTADENAKEILRHIDGVLVSDPTTGLLRLKLIRADYTVADLSVFDRSNTANLSHTRQQMPELVTEVKANFTDRAADYTQRTRAAYNQALRQYLGRAQGIATSYPLFTTGANAERAATRDLHAHSSEFATGTMTANRSAAGLSPGDVFVINDPDEGLSSVVCRATRLDYGTIHEKESVTVQWAEDVFGSQGGVYVTDPPDEWVEPTGTNAGQRFDVDTVVTLDATEGCLTLRITGDISAITLVETQTQVGGAAASGWTTQSNSAPITVCVNRADVEPSRIAYRISYTDGDGTTQTLEDEVEVQPRGQYKAPRIDLKVDSGTGVVTAIVVPDGGVAASVRCVDSTSDYPADATVDAGTPDTSSPFTFTLSTLTAGQTSYVKAVATDSSGRKSPYATAFIARAGGGVSDAEFLVGAAHGSLTAERVVTLTATVAWDLATAGQAKADVRDSSITEDKQVLADVSTQNVSTTKHGYVPKAPNDTTKYLRGDGSWAVPSSTPSPGGILPYNYPHNDAIDDPVNDNFLSGALDTTGARFSGAAAWTVDNSGGTYTMDGGKLWLISPSSASLQIRGAYVAVPSGNWCIRAQCYLRGGVTSQRKVGLYLRDSTSGKLETWGIGYSAGLPLYWAGKWTTNTSYSATRSTFGVSATTGMALLAPFLEIEYDGTNYYLRAGFADGGCSLSLLSFAKTNFLSAAADGIGLFSMNDSSTATTLMCSAFYRVPVSVTL